MVKCFYILICIAICKLCLCDRGMAQGNESVLEKNYLVYFVKSPYSKADDDLWICAGALVSPKQILTAAACLVEMDRIYAIAGYKKYIHGRDIEKNACTEMSKRKVVKIIVPKEYKLSSDKPARWLSIDVGVAIVEKPYNFPDQRYHVHCSFEPQIILINFEKINEMEKSQAVAVGWGGQRTGSPSISSTQNIKVQPLQEATMMIIDKKDCLSLAPNEELQKLIDKYFVCVSGNSLLDDRDYKPRDDMERCTNERHDDLTRPIDNTCPEDDFDFRRRNTNNTDLRHNNYANDTKINNTRSRRSSSESCQIDHGSPLVRRVGEQEMVIGIALSGISNENYRCNGPRLCVSTAQTVEIIKCLLKMDVNIRKQCNDQITDKRYEANEIEIKWPEKPYNKSPLEENAKKIPAYLRQGNEEEPLQVRPTKDLGDFQDDPGKPAQYGKRDELAYDSQVDPKRSQYYSPQDQSQDQMQGQLNGQYRDQSQRQQQQQPYDPYEQPREESNVNSYKPPQEESYSQPQIDSYNQPQIDSYGQPQIDSYRQPQIDSYGQPQIDSYRQPQVDSFGQPQVDSYSPPQVDSYSPPQVDSYSPPQVDSYSPPQVDSYSPPQVDSYSPPQVDSYSPPQVDSYSPPKVDSYSQPKVDSYSQPQVDSYGQPQVDSYSPPLVDSYNKPPQIDSYSQPKVDTYNQPQSELYNQPQEQLHNEPQIRQYDQPQVQLYNEPQANSNNRPQLDSYNPSQIGTYNPQQMESYNPPQVESYNPPKLESYNPTKIESYNPTKIESYKPSKIGSYNPSQIESFNPPKIEYYNPPKIELPQVEPYNQPPMETYNQPAVESYKKPPMDTTNNNQPQGQVYKQPQIDAHKPPQQIESYKQPQGESNNQQIDPFKDSYKPPQFKLFNQPHADLNNKPETGSFKQSQIQPYLPQLDLEFNKQPQIPSYNNPDMISSKTPSVESYNPLEILSGKKTQMDSFNIPIIEPYKPSPIEPYKQSAQEPIMSQPFKPAPVEPYGQPHLRQIDQTHSPQNVVQPFEPALSPPLTQSADQSQNILRERLLGLTPDAPSSDTQTFEQIYSLLNSSVISPPAIQASEQTFEELYKNLHDPALEIPHDPEFETLRGATDQTDHGFEQQFDQQLEQTFGQMPKLSDEPEKMGTQPSQKKDEVKVRPQVPLDYQDYLSYSRRSGTNQ